MKNPFEATIRTFTLEISKKMQKGYKELCFQAEMSLIGSLLECLIPSKTQS